MQKLTGLPLPTALVAVLLAASTAIANPPITLERVAGGFSRPTDVTAPAGDTDRVFVVQHRGLIRIVDRRSGTISPTPFLDIRERVANQGDSGLLGMAFHPDYGANGHFFVHYQSRVGGNTIIARYTVSDSDPNSADFDSEKVVLFFQQPNGYHLGGSIAFSPADGYLYAAFGDGGPQRDTGNHAQDPQRFLGKILRLDVDSDEPYVVPADNPFVDEKDVRPEIWAFGFRNPWRFSFDPDNGDLYVGDVGQNGWEEIDYQPASSAGGENYEWRVREGDHDHATETPYTFGTRTGPLLEYGHSGGNFNGRSVTGGVVYRGSRLLGYEGAYFFADYNLNWVRSMRVVNGQPSDIEDHTFELNLGIEPASIENIVAFGTDGLGEIYILDFRGTLYRIAPPTPPGPQFHRADSNGDRVVDISDPIHTAFYLFDDVVSSVPCLDASDSNDSGEVDISDVIHTLGVLFRGAGVILPPFPLCWEDPTEDLIACENGACG